MRRSNSSSSIPVPRTSRLPLRNSIQKARGVSVNRLTIDKKTSDKNLKRSNSHSNFLDVPLIRRQGSGSLARKNSVTPSQSRKSPLLSSTRKDTRPLTDRGWQYEQVVKVRKFVASQFPDLGHDNVKSGIALDVFVELVNYLFQCIDDRIHITKENYIEEIASNLKRYRYPTTIKPSLMKTVNTSHSWPHVVAILSWLVDLVTEIDYESEEEDNLHTVSDNACLEAFMKWNQGTNENEAIESVSSKLNKQLDELLNVNEESLFQYDAELDGLQNEHKELENKKSMLLKETEILKVQNKEKSNKCDVYEAENAKFVKLTTEQIAKYCEQIKRNDEELIDATKTEEQMKIAIASQKYSLSNYVQLTQEIKELQYTHQLKQEKCKAQDELLTKCDSDLINLRQKIEKNAYEYNNIIDQLEVLNEDFKKCHVPVTGFIRIDTKKKIEEITSFLKTVIIQIKEEQKVIYEKIDEKKQEIVQITEETATINSKVKKLSALDLELTLTLECERKKYKSETDSLLNKLHSLRNKLEELKDLKKSTVVPLQEKLMVSQTRASELDAYRKELNIRALQFFTSLVPKMINDNKIYREQMDEVSRAVIVNLKNQIDIGKNQLEQINKTAEKTENLQPK